MPVQGTHFFGATPFYNGVVSTSLRFDKAGGNYLYRTFSSGNRRTFTIAFWYKTSLVFSAEASDQNNPLFYADEPSGSGVFQLNISSQGQGASSDTMNELSFYDYDSADSTDYSLETNRGFNDTSAWYHIVAAFDTTQAAQANRVKYYINGVQHDFDDTNSHHDAVPQNRELNVNQNDAHWIGRNIDTTTRYLNGYLADFNFIDGTQYDASNFGEFKNGIWIPKDTSGLTFGTNGFRLQFKQTGTGTASASTVGADTSGNDNHFTSSGIAANDIVPDCPENNFCTMAAQSFSLAAKGTLSGIAEGGLKIDSTDHQVHTSTFAIPASGKWYWEINNVGTSGNFIVQYQGVMSTTIFHTEQDYPSSSGSVGEYIRNLAGVSYIAGNDIYYKNFTATSTSNGANEGGGFSEANGEGILGLAIDTDAGTIKYYWNNSLVRTDSTLTANIEYFVSTNLTNSGGNIWSSATYNFGQDSSFAGTKTAQGNTDANGNGDFFYSVPSGHLALCSANLPEPTIGPNSATQSDDHFDTILYTGNGSARDIGGLNFQPDWVWVKGRSYTDHHALYDSNRGVLKTLFSNGNFAENTDSDALDEFRSDGFGINGTGAGLMNTNTETYVAWNWKANGGTTSSNDTGTTTSTVQANTTAGFSIISYAGNASSRTIGHGLSSAPEWVIAKSLTDAERWLVFHTSTPNGYHYFNDTFAIQTGNADERFGDSSSVVVPSSTLITMGANNSDINESGDNYIMYCFHSVDGYSKFGDYKGNGNINGTYIFTGFRPAFLIIRRTDDTKDWIIFDNKREGFNKFDTGGAGSGNDGLNVNDTSAEGTADQVDLLANGFKLRATGTNNNHATGNFIYMAFAEAPFKYANAR